MGLSGIAPERAIDYGARWSRCRRILLEEDCDAAYIVAGPNFTWLSGVSPFPGGWPIWLSCLIVPARGDLVMVISRMHANLVDRKSLPFDRLITYDDGDDVSDVLRNALVAAGVTTGRVAVEDSLGFADSELLKGTNERLHLIRGVRAYQSLRAVKDTFELDLLRQSAAAVDAIYEAARDTEWSGRLMAEVGLELLNAQLKAGTTQPKIGGAFRNYRPLRFAVGDVVDLDTGASFSGYSVDTARNVFVGKVDRSLEEKYGVVEAAFLAAESAVKAGTSASAVHDAGAGVLTSAGLDQAWKVGHGVGLADGHEAPLLQPGNDQVLERNMVITIDPGFFIGVDRPLHIEDTVVVTDVGCERLNRFTHQMLIV
jgi:Xaa-Pro dipeptidase